MDSAGRPQNAPDRNLCIGPVDGDPGNGLWESRGVMISGRISQKKGLTVALYYVFSRADNP